MENVRRYIEENRETFLEEFMDLLRIPSVSADPAHAGDMVRCAARTADLFRKSGIPARVEETPGHPIVRADYVHPDNDKTFLVYGHYDVQPPDPLDKWLRPPFEPWIDGEDVVARGASDDKGQFLTHLFAARAHLETRGRIPINLVFLIEGEEEITSTHLAEYLRRNAENLRARGALVSDTAMYGPDTPALGLGLRGIAAAEIRLRGPARDLHSGGFGGAVANPALELARILASLHDRDRRVAIPGFYDRVREIPEEERRRLPDLPFDENKFLESTGAPALWGEKGYTTLERIWFRPTCEVNGMGGGYQGEGGKTIIPSCAGAKVTMRLVPDQDPETILELFEAHVRRTASPAVELEVKKQGGADPVSLPPGSPLARAAEKALEKAFGRKPFFIRSGGSIPVVGEMKKILGLDVLLLGFGLEDDRCHSPNEKFSLRSFHKGILTSAHLVEELASLED